MGHSPLDMGESSIPLIGNLTHISKYIPRPIRKTFILSNDDALKNLRRIVVPQKVWDILQREKA